MSQPVEIRVSLQSDEQPIPYSASEDGENAGYRSLLNEPAGIDELPELASEPAFKEFIRTLNAPGGTFESVRVVHWTGEPPGGFSRCFAVGFIFRDRVLFSQYANCLLFAGNVLQNRCRGTIQSDESILLEIQPAILRAENLRGWVMDLYVGSLGQSEEIARLRLDQMVARLIPLFRNGGTDGQPAVS